jgi:hypothetical protein
VGLRTLTVVPMQERRFESETGDHDGAATDSHSPPEMRRPSISVKRSPHAPASILSSAGPTHHDHRHRPVARHVDQPAPFGRARRRGDNSRAPDLLGFEWRVSTWLWLHAPDFSAGCHRDESKLEARERVPDGKRCEAEGGKTAETTGDRRLSRLESGNARRRSIPKTHCRLG